MSRNENIKKYYRLKAFEKHEKERNEKSARRKLELQAEHIDEYYRTMTFEQYEPKIEASRCTYGIYDNEWQRAFHNCHVRAPNFRGYIDEFKTRMETNFEEGMTWKNYGEWEIDHIIPLDRGGPHAVNNLQPLWKKENRTKGNKLEREIKEQTDKLERELKNKQTNDRQIRKEN